MLCEKCGYYDEQVIELDTLNQGKVVICLDCYKSIEWEQYEGKTCGVVGSHIVIKK